MNSATTVKASRLLVAASERNSGRTTKRPASTRHDERGDGVAQRAAAWPRHDRRALAERGGEGEEEDRHHVLRHEDGGGGAAHRAAVDMLRSARMRLTTAVEERASETPMISAVSRRPAEREADAGEGAAAEDDLQRRKPQHVALAATRISCSEKCRPMSNSRKTTPSWARTRANGSLNTSRAASNVTPCLA